MLHPKVKEQIKKDNLIWLVEQKKKQLDELIAKLRVMKLSKEEKEKLIKVLRK